MHEARAREQIEVVQRRGEKGIADAAPDLGAEDAALLAVDPFFLLREDHVGRDAEAFERGAQVMIFVPQAVKAVLGVEGASEAVEGEGDLTSYPLPLPPLPLGEGGRVAVRPG